MSRPLPSPVTEMRNLRLLLLAATLLAGAACGGGASTAGPARGASTRSPIGPDEIAAASQGDLYELVRALRPTWLRRRGATSITRFSDVVVYLDDVRYGDTSSLRGISPQSVERVEFLDAGSATLRWGTNHVHGAIVVRTRR